VLVVCSEAYERGIVAKWCLQAHAFVIVEAETDFTPRVLVGKLPKFLRADPSAIFLPVRNQNVSSYEKYAADAIFFLTMRVSGFPAAKYLWRHR